MKSFKDFIKEDDIPSINVQPVHGAHAQEPAKKTPSVNAQPTHGEHAQKKESLDEATKKLREGSYSWGQRHDNDHLGHTIDDVHKAISKTSDEFEKHPHNEDVYKYTRDSYATNRELVRRNQGYRPQTEHDEHINNLDKALSHEPTKHNLYVYHGTSKWNPAEHLKGNPTKTVHVPTYMSTSIDRHMGTFFSGMGGGDTQHVIRIKVPKGSHGMYIGDNSKHQSEKEFLLPRDQHLKFKSVRPTKVLDSGGGGKIHVWDAEVHHQPQNDDRQLSLPFKKKDMKPAYDPHKPLPVPTRWAGVKK